jgi:outer membrane cobalamin receptor
MTKIYLIPFITILFALQVSAQNHTISGYIEDLKTGEHLLSANAFDGITLKGTSSNYYGFYSLKLPEGLIKLTYSYAGYQTIVLEFVLNKDTIINPKLDPITAIDEVVVSTNQRNIAKNNQMGLIEMTAIQTKKLPVFLGESDILKTIQLLPGVKGGTEGTSGIYVRGGGPDQNLILLDGVPVYNANHLFGFFSVFNSDAIQSFSLLKGGFPARYGGRLSSVLDIKMKEGNNKKFGGEVSIGLISSKLTLEGPIKNENTSFIISARRTYIDVIPYLVLKSMNSPSIGGYYFYDVNAKINHKFSNRSRLYYSLYNGLDKFYFDYNNTYENETTTGETGSGWGNTIHALRWNYIINDQLFCNSTATYSNYNFFVRFYNKIETENGDNIISYEYTSGITDITGKVDFDYIPNPNNYIKFGTNYTSHVFNPGVNALELKDNNTTSNIDTSFGNSQILAHEVALYAEDDINITSKLKVNIGIHYSLFNVKNKSYHSFQPRISTRYLINENLSAKASVVHMQQYIHLLTSSNIGLPTDLWVPTTNKLKPMNAWQSSIGMAYNLNSKYEFSIEAYYKPMLNLIEYKEGASFLSQGNDWENKVETGKGWAKGIELLINKTSGKTTGWIGYTLSQTTRQFSQISEGKEFPYKYDRRHDIGIAITHKPSEKFDFGIVWVYGTGTATTLAEEKYPSKNMLNSNSQFYESIGMIEYFSKRNSYRMPAYHRLDIGFNFIKKIKWGSRTWSFGAYNAYNHQNPFFLFFSDNKNEGLNFMGSSSGDQMYLKQISVFPIIPYVKYAIKF